MAYKRKTHDEWTLYIDYGYGFEEETTEFTYKDIMQRVKEYRENCPQYARKIEKHRVKETT